MTRAALLPLLGWHDVTTSTRPGAAVAATYLYADACDDALATLHKSKSGKWYPAYCDLPGLVLARRQGPLAEMRELVRSDVGRWLVRATHPDALPLMHGAGI